LHASQVDYQIEALSTSSYSPIPKVADCKAIERALAIPEQRPAPWSSVHKLASQWQHKRLLWQSKAVATHQLFQQATQSHLHNQGQEHGARR
jgi:hypothetical protein